jgi:methyl-accepting chemotaxis protein
VAQSTDDIGQGHALTQLVSEALSSSASHVEAVHAAMDEAVRLSRDGEAQTHACIAQVRELDAHGADNRGLVVQLSAAADSLQRQGDRLGRQVDLFTLS